MINLSIGVSLSSLDVVLAQFGEGIWGQVISLIMFIVFIFFYQRIMVTQILFKLEKSAQLLENMSDKSKKTVLGKISKKPDSKLKRSVNRFLEFFVISPVSLDPYGVVKKFEHLIDLEKDRFKYFVNQVAPKLDSENKANLMMGLSGAISLYMLTKLVRHFVELIKQTKSVNLAMVLQMQLPLIERLARALLHGTEALANGWPVGDTIGAYAAANLIDNSKVIKADDETVVCRKKYKKRDVIIVKAKGPGGRTGNPGRVVEKIVRKEKIAKIITIDAALKLEGEKTGTIAEGVGVAIGGIGVEKTYIENIAVKKNLPLDSIIIKMSQEEAITPMKKEILNSVPLVTQALDAAIDRTKEKGKIIVVGVGNTSGVGNNKKDVEKAKELIKKSIKKMKALAKKRKKRFRFPF
jgi:hypothetical protein